MTKLYNHDTAQWEDVADEDVAGGVTTGKYSFAAGQQVPVFNEAGEYGFVPAEVAGEAFANEGFRFATRAEEEEQDAQARFGDGAGNSVRAFVEGVARDVTFGASDIALQGFGVSQRGLRERRKRNVSADVGEAAGFIGTALATGGGSLLGKAGAKAGAKVATKALAKEATEEVATAAIKRSAFEKAAVEAAAQAATKPGMLKRAARMVTAPGRGVFAAGDAAQEWAEYGVRKALGGTDNVASRIAAKALPQVARGGVEGGLLSTREILTENVLGEPPKSAEQIIGHLGLGTVLGAGAGSVFSLAGMAFKSGAKAMHKAVIKAAPDIEAAASKLALKDVGVKFGKKKLGPEKINGMRKFLLRDAGVSLKDNADDVFRKLEASQSKAGERIEQLAKKVDDAVPEGISHVPDRIEQRLNAEVLKPLKQSLFKGERDAASRVQAEFQAFFDAFRPIQQADGALVASNKLSFRELHKFRSQLDSFIWKNRRNPPVHIAELRKARFIVEDELRNAADEVKGLVGKSIRGDWEEAMEKYAFAAELTKAAEGKAAREANGKILPFSDLLAGAAGAAAFGAPGAVVAGVGRRLVEGKVPMGMAMAVDKLSTLGVLERANTEATQRLEGIVDAFGKRLLGAPRKVTTKATTKGSDTLFDLLAPLEGDAPTVDKNKPKYQQHFEKMERFVTDQNYKDARLARMVEGSSPDAPQLSLAAARTIERAAEYLYRIAPKPPGHVMGVMALGREAVWEPDAREKAEYRRHLEAIQNPMQALQAFADGDVTYQQMDGIRRVYPELWRDFTVKIMQKVHSMPEVSIKYDDKVRLSMLLGVPVDAMMTRTTLAFLQSLRAADKSVKPGTKPKGSGTEGGSKRLTESLRPRISAA